MDTAGSDEEGAQKVEAEAKGLKGVEDLSDLGKVLRRRYLDIK